MKEVLITSSVLILVLLLLRAICAKKVRRTLIYSAWALVALRLLIPVQIGQLDFSLLTVAQPVIEAVDERLENAILGNAPQTAYRNQVEHYIERDHTVFIPEVQDWIRRELEQGTQSTEEIYDKLQKQFLEQEILTDQGQELVSGAAGFKVNGILHAFQQTILTIWIVGIGMMTVWFFVVNLRHNRTLKNNRERLECDSPIPVFVSDKVTSPCLVGLLNPVVYVTSQCAADPKILRHVLTHELTHYAHKDHIWSLVRCVCLCVYWFDPFVWIAAAVSRRDCELACDEGAIKRLGEAERLAYGKSLLEVVSYVTPTMHLMQTATSMNETKKQLKTRVSYIARRPKFSVITAICMVLVCVLVAGCVAAGSTPKDQGSAPTEPTEPFIPTNPTSPSTQTQVKEPVPQDPADLLAMIPEEIQRQIKEDYFAQFMAEDDIGDANRLDHTRLRVYGVFGDTYVLFVDVPGIAYSTAISKGPLNRYVITLPSSQQMYIYQDGHFYMLFEAAFYEILTDEEAFVAYTNYTNRQKFN